MVFPTFFKSELGNKEFMIWSTWDGWMASSTWWTWVWVDSGSWWWTGRPGMLQFMGSQRVRHDWVTELYWTDLSHSVFPVLFCWLYRISPSLAAKNILNLISVLTIWWCPCVESSLVLLEERVFAMTIAFSWQNSISLCPASFCTPRPNLPVTPGVSWIPTFAFQSPIMKRTSFLGVNYKRSCRSS